MQSATALGADAQATGINSTALGVFSDAEALDSLAAGYNANAAGASATPALHGFNRGARRRWPAILFNQ